MNKSLFFSLLLLFPLFTFAQTLSAQGFITGFLIYSNSVLLPAALGIAFLFFIINAIRFFVVNGANEEGRENAKNLAIYGVLTFVILVVFWGVINLLAGSVGLNAETAPTPDYLQKNEGSLDRTGARNPGGANTSGTNPCGTLEQDFDNEFGGPCSTNGKTAPSNVPADNNNPGEPINLLPPQYEVPTENVNCPPGSSFNSGSNTCDYQ